MNGQLAGAAVDAHMTEVKNAREPDLPALSQRVYGLRERLLQHSCHLETIADRLYGPIPTGGGSGAGNPISNGAIGDLRAAVDALSEALEYAEEHRRRLGGLA